MTDKKITVDSTAEMQKADLNGDGHLDKIEMEMMLDAKRKRLDDEDAMRDAQRNMAWFALFGMLLYPFSVVLSSLVGLEQAASTLGDMAPTYFVSVAAIVAAFYAKEGIEGMKK